ncbi:MAG: AbrB/MazE/SpoVT family DNA-binding domain-containing protein [Bacteroidia bacterium]|nr:AbrB/MazE/SpoVT family DNA-binding domain-containing protein [Bacteroidia bacterium]
MEKAKHFTSESSASVTTSKHQIIVPKNLRKKYNIKPGTRIIFTDKGNGEIIMRALTKEYFESLAGWLNAPGILEDLIKEKKFEKSHDEKRYLR